ncbi:MAG: hypothetical protein WCQ57_12255 [Verrucomicrobiota bacterium]
MRNPRILMLAGAITLLSTVVIWRWMSGWGLVTITVTNAPISKVIKSIERQGGVRIVTNADPSMPVTLYLKRVPVYEAMDSLAIRADGDIRLAYIAAPEKKQITDVLAAFTTGTNPGGWAVVSAGFGGFNGPTTTGDSRPDPRQIEWKISDVSDRSLQAVFQQGAQKTGALFATPQTWNPVLGKLPSAGRTGKVTSRIVKTANGQFEELFLLTVRPPRPEGDRTAGELGQQRWEGSQTVFTPQRGNREGMNPEWMAERIQSEIALLPADERPEAQNQFDEMRKFWDSVRKLPEDERRAKVDEMMNNPEVQARMDERMAARDSKRTPAQREQRMKRYIERKQEMKTTPAKS